MLTDDERSEIEATLPHYPHRRSAAAGAMRIVQRHRGYLSDDALADIGAFLGCRSTSSTRGRPSPTCSSAAPSGATSS